MQLLIVSSSISTPILYVVPTSMQLLIISSSISTPILYLVPTSMQLLIISSSISTPILYQAPTSSYLLLVAVTRPPFFTAVTYQQLLTNSSSNYKAAVYNSYVFIPPKHVYWQINILLQTICNILHLVCTGELLKSYTQFHIKNILKVHIL